MRNKLVRIIAAGLLAFTGFSSQVSAQSNSNQDTAGPNRVFGAVEWFNSHVNQKSQEALTYDQSIWAGMIGYEYSERSSLYFLARGMWGGGSGDTTQDDINYDFYTHPWFVGGRVGYQFGLGDSQEFGVTPFTGYFYNSGKSSLASIDGTVTGAYTKVRKQSIPVGVVLDWRLMPQFEVGLSVEALINIWGRVSQGQDGVNETTDNLKNKVDWSFEIPMTYHYDKEWDITLVPFYDWKDYKTKDNNGEKFTVSNLGLRLEAGYNF
jgi:hypothetical protein